MGVRQPVDAVDQERWQRYIASVAGGRAVAVVDGTDRSDAKFLVKVWRRRGPRRSLPLRGKPMSSMRDHGSWTRPPVPPEQPKKMRPLLTVCLTVVGLLLVSGTGYVVRPLCRTALDGR